jgi:hypothetical protein
MVCLQIFEERFTVFKGEWDLVYRKSKRNVRSQKQSINGGVHESLEKIACAAEE